MSFYHTKKYLFYIHIREKLNIFEEKLEQTRGGDNMNIFKKIRKSKLGFPLVEISIIIAVVVVVLAVLAPALISYTEVSRKQRDETATAEMINAFELALIDSEVLDESLRYEIANNFLTYSDSTGTYASQDIEQEFWAPDGSGRAVTITFNPDEDGTYVLADGYVNEMTFGNGSVATPTRLMQQRGNADPVQCKFAEMESANKTHLLYSQVTQNVGDTVKMRSATYRNSSFTVFIKYAVSDGVVKATVSGSWNGEDLSPDCPAALGSGTTGFDEDNNPNGDRKGTTESQFDSSALQGSGSITFKGYDTLEGEYIDSEKFWNFCQSVSSDITGIHVVSVYTENPTVDISVSGNGRIVAFQEADAIYISAAAPDGKDNKMLYTFKVRPSENASNLFDANKTGLTNVRRIGVDMLDVSKCISIDSMFKDNAKITSINMDSWDMSNISNFTSAFEGCTSLKNIKLISWNTAKAEKMGHMFADCQALERLDVSRFNTANVEDMSYMFYNCASLINLDVSKFDTSKVRTMASMFEGCVKVNALDVSNFDVGIVMDFSSMFKDCLKIKTLNVSSWETALNQNMSKMFMNCKSLTELNLENWNTANVKNMEQMFYACQYIEELDLSTFNNLNAANVKNMFGEMNRLVMITLGAKFSFRGNGATSCTLPTPSPKYIDGADGLWRDEAGAMLSPANIPSKVAATYHAVTDTLPAILAERDTWWKGRTDKEDIVRIKIVNRYRSPRYDETWVADADNNGSIVVYIEGDTAYLVNMKNSRAKNAFQLSYDATNTFAGFTNLREIQGLRLINMINTTVADNFFEGCTSLVSIDGYERWNVQNLRSTSNMFASTKIPFLKLGAWDLATNTNFSGMFANTQLTELDLANWDVSNIESFAGMFQNSNKLMTVILKAWDTNPNASYTDMFSGCSALTTIYTSSTFEVGTTNTNMFNGCTNIMGGMGTTYVDGTSAYARVDTATNPGYFTSDENVGTFVARLYATGSVSTVYDELTFQGATATPWNYRQGAKLLEISLYAMPKGIDKSLTVTVPEGMKIVKNSWTQPNGHITNVYFDTLDRNANKEGIQQNSGVYVNNEAGTLTFVIDPKTTQTTIQMLVNVDMDLWSKRASSTNITKEDAIVVALCDDAVVKTMKNITMGNGLGNTTEGFSLGYGLNNSLIYEGQPQTIYNNLYLSKHEETASVYWTEAEIKVTTESTQSGLSAKIVGGTNPWASQIVEDNSTDYVFHKKYQNIQTSSLNFPRLEYLLEEGAGWQKGESLKVKTEITVKYYNGETKTYVQESKVTVKTATDEVDWSLLTISGSGQTVPTLSYFAGAASDIADHLGYTSVTYKGAVDIPNLHFKYEYDVDHSGVPNVMVQAARVVLPKGQSTIADVTFVSETGAIKGPYQIELKSTNSNYGAYISAMHSMPDADKEGKTWYLKTVEYTIDKLVGSATSQTNYHATSAGKSTSSAGATLGRVRNQGSHKVTISHNGVVYKTATYTSKTSTAPTYSAYVSAISTPLGNTITAGDNFQLDISVSACSYPYAITSNLVDPVIWVVLPEDVSIIGAKVLNSSGTVVDSNPNVTRLKSFYKEDGTIAYVYKVHMTNPQLMSQIVVGKTSITSRNATLKFQILVETDATMRSTSMLLRDMIWFSDSHGRTALSGSYGGYGTTDRYDVNCNGNNTEQLSVTDKTTTSISIQGVLD